MKTIKRMDKERLRQGAPKGRRVIYAYDPACINFTYWQQLKQEAGIYFVTRATDNMLKEEIGDPPWDKEDPVNQGVQSVHFIRPRPNICFG